MAFPNELDTLSRNVVKVLTVFVFPQMFADIRFLHSMMLSSGFPQHDDVHLDSVAVSTHANRSDQNGLNEDGLEYWLHTTYAKSCDSESDDYSSSSCSYVMDHYGPYTE